MITLISEFLNKTLQTGEAKININILAMTGVYFVFDWILSVLAQSADTKIWKKTTMPKTK